MRQNVPSQISSAEPQMLRARVYHTAMKAAPRHKQIVKPSSAPSHIYCEKLIEVELLV